MDLNSHPTDSFSVNKAKLSRIRNLITRGNKKQQKQNNILYFEATWILFKQLDRLKTEEKLLKKRREKRRQS
ncbi:hypothetical protein YC2023_039604 [Brassica napus]